MQPPAHLQPAIRQLVKCYVYARDLGVPVSEFALSVAQLRQHGAELADLRWLQAKGFIQHQVESTSESGQRGFRPTGSNDWSEKSVVWLTDTGVRELLRLSGINHCLGLLSQSDSEIVALPREASPPSGGAKPSAAAGVATEGPKSPAKEQVNGGAVIRPLLTPAPRPAAPIASSGSRPDHELLPQWSHEMRELRFRGELIKRFRVPADSQELVLDAFEVAGWPSEIIDPLEPTRDATFDRRRRAAVCQSLNRNQVMELLHFSSRGGDRLIRWQALQ